MQEERYAIKESSHRHLYSMRSPRGVQRTWACWDAKSRDNTGINPDVSP
jgi:hypothetical protein